MKLIIKSYEIQSEGSYLLNFSYGGEEFSSLVKIIEGVVPYTDYDEHLQNILHKDVGEAKNMNSIIFKIHNKENIELPISIGDF